VYATLYQFLILNKQLSLPGIGTIYLQKTSSELDFGNKIFTSPTYNFKIEHGREMLSKKLFNWISKELYISELDAIRMLNDFSFDLKKKISSESKVNWPKVGMLLKDNKGEIILDSPSFNLDCEKPVFAEKVIREKAEHTMLVGEMEKSVSEMEELLGEETIKKDYFWIIAVILCIASILFTGLYLSEKGLNPSAIGNQSVIKLK
jgi:hypothetical protein